MAIKVIYIDDEPDICEAFALIIESDTIQVFTFTSPNEVLKNIDSINPDLFISDFRMPGMNGVELARKLPAKLPKVLLTGEEALKDTSEFIKVFRKPCNFNMLRSFFNDFESSIAKGGAS